MVLGAPDQRAQQYVADDTLTLTEITFLLGFSEMSSFSRAFKNLKGWIAAHDIDVVYGEVDTNPETIEQYLTEAGHRSITVPYRENRAVILDSDLFHRTDQFLEFPFMVAGV